MSRSSAEKWAKLSKLGRRGFILRYGVLGWGVPTAILFSLVQAYSDGWDTFLLRLVPALVLFPLGGILWGAMMWRFLERRNARAMVSE